MIGHKRKNEAKSDQVPNHVVYLDEATRTMKNDSGQIDWQRTEEHAETLSDLELNCAIHDIRATLKHTDEIDRASGTCDGGYYRDVISVYQQEMKRRKK